MNKNTFIAASGILLCAGSAAGQGNPPFPQEIRRRVITGTPERQSAARTRAEQCHALNMAGFTALHTGQYTAAEDDARHVLAVSHGQDILAPELLAESLDAQGKNAEALAAYQTLADQGSGSPRVLLPYALLLLKDGRWPEAVASYNKAAPSIAFGQLIAGAGHFTAANPEPTTLGAAIHVGLGLTYLSSADWAGNSRRDRGMEHLQEALRLVPNSALANYYYGYGLQKIGRRAEAQAAFKKTAALDDGNIKAAALKQLPATMQPR